LSFVLDASALIAVLRGEPGGNGVVRRLRGSSVATVNYTEVCSRLSDLGADVGVVIAKIRRLGVIVVPFDYALAVEASRLRPLTRHAGLSLGDRACLALALRERATVLTADRVWATVDVGCTIELIR